MLTSSASWLAFVSARSAKMKVRDWDAPLPASPNTFPLNRTPPLSVVLFPCATPSVSSPSSHGPLRCHGVVLALPREEPVSLEGHADLLTRRRRAVDSSPDLVVSCLDRGDLSCNGHFSLQDPYPISQVTR